MILYAIRDFTWTDPFGDKHYVDQVVDVIEVEKAGFFPYHNGYYDHPCRVYVHLPSKRSIVAIPPKDFGASTYYLCEPSFLKGTRLVAHLSKRTIDLDGNVYLSKKLTLPNKSDRDKYIDQPEVPDDDWDAAESYES